MNSNSAFNWPVRVYYEDTDAGGVVYHSQYLNYLERARTEFLRGLGFEQTDLREQLNLVIVVHSLQIQFKKPAKFNDMLNISTQIATLGRSSISFAQTITRGVNTQVETLIEAQVKVACVDMLKFKPVAIPPAILHQMEQS